LTPPRDDVFTDLSRRERQILRVLYERGSADVAEVATHLPDPPTRNAVRTLLGILVAKGHAKAARDGRRNVYRPSKRRGSVATRALTRVLDVFFGGSMPDALAAWFADSPEKLTEDEIARFAELIAEARRKGR
jgi:predicted transcriptional regulator